jgi:ATP-dependent DNA ligase
MDHIRRELRVLREAGFVGTLDGELYFHDKGAENFQDIMKAIKKYRPGTSEQVEYWVYDIIDLSKTALIRADMYNELINNNDVPHIKSVPQHLCYHKGQVDMFHEQHLGDGFEGTMLKNANSYYQPDRRSSDLLKKKDFQDAEYMVIDIIPMEKKPECGIAVCQGQFDGQIFKATPKMSYEDRRDLLQNKHKYIGQKATVTFFSLTDDGLPRFPVLKGFRLDV